MFKALQKFLYNFHAEQCLAQVCCVAEYIKSLSRSELSEIISLLRRLLEFSTLETTGFFYITEFHAFVGSEGFSLTYFLVIRVQLQ